jgi:CRP/FNR family transcriptional regulator
MTKNTFLEKITHYGIFDDLEDSDLDRLSEGSGWVSFNQGKTIFEAGSPVDYVYIVCFGSVKLVQTTSNGAEVILHFVPEGGLVAGVVAMQPNGRYPLSAVAHEPSGLIKIKSSTFRELVSAKSNLAQKLLHMISLRVNDLHSEKAVKMKNVPFKIAEFLIRTLEKQKNGSKTKIQIKLTRQDIANAVGTTVETTIRVLSQWTQDKIIATEGQNIEVLNKEALRKILNED